MQVLRMNPRTLPLAAGLLLALSSAAQAVTVFEVPTTAYPTIQSALAAAYSGDVIELVQAGIVYELRDGVVPASITIRGQSGDPADYTLSPLGPPCLYALRVAPGLSLQLQGLSLAGYTTQDGALVLGSSSSLDAEGCIFSGNEGAGAVVGVDAVVSIKDCLFSANQTAGDGAAICLSTSTLLVLQSEFEGNAALGGDGGALYLAETPAELLDSRFSQNTGLVYGGAVAALNTSLQPELWIEGCEFSANSAEIGGAIATEMVNGTVLGTVFAGNSGDFGGAVHHYNTDMVYAETLFLQNQASTSGGAVVMDQLEGAVLLQLGGSSFHDCRFQGNQAQLQGGAASVTGLQPSSTGTRFVSCLFTQNKSGFSRHGGGGALFLSHTQASVENGLFIGNAVNTPDDILDTHGNAIYIHQSLAVLQVTASTFTGNGTGETSEGVIFNRDGTLICHSTDISMNNDGVPIWMTDTPQYDFSHMNLFDGDWSACIPPNPTCVNAHSFDPLYVDAAGGDYRHRHDSPCLERGHPGVGRDFDRTLPDIGWSPAYPEIELSGTVGALEHGHYLVTGPTTITGPQVEIPDGTVFKLQGTATLSLRNTGPDPEVFAIGVGDEAGARTAIVFDDGATGTVYLGNDRADHALSALELGGVLFNHGNDAMSTWQPTLLFENCALDIAWPQVRFHNYGLSRIDFWSVCRGRFAGFDFTEQQIFDHDGQFDPIGAGLGWIESYYSDVVVDGVRFDEVSSPMYWKLFSQGLAPGARPVISNSHFKCDFSYAWSTPLYFAEHAPRLHHNTFEVGPRAIVLANATLDLSNGALNHFERPSTVQDQQEPMIYGYQSPADLFCGYNSFVQSSFDSQYPRIVAGCASLDWSANFVGTDCSSPIPNPAAAMSACTGLVLDGLAQCPPPNSLVPCEDPVLPYTLYAQGLEADAEGNWEAAVAWWSALLVDYPEEKYATEVSGRIKGIGLVTDYGAEAFDFVRGRLDAGATASQAVDSLLSLYQSCSSWVLEGRHGDRPAALTALDGLLLVYAGQAKALLTIEAAIAEIDAFEPQGGFSAADPLQAVAQRATRARGLHAMARVWAPEGLQPAAAPAEPGAAAGPAAFALSACWPNPFNPSTQVELYLGEAGPVRVTVYNLAGQRVRTLHEGALPAGATRLVFDAGELASGLYLIEARQGSQRAVAKALLAR
jgi:predicted outer membrane repeat protein